MEFSTYILVFGVFFAFLFAGVVKGLLGMGLPPVAVGLLALLMPPVQAAALVVVPAFVTNIWQMSAGPGFIDTFKRLWRLLAGICFGTWVGSVVIPPDEARITGLVLGTALAVYSILILTAVQFAVPRRMENWLSPFIGLVSGMVMAATGISVVPLVPYLQALNMEKEELLQAMGVTFIVSVIALAAMLFHIRVLQPSNAAGSLFALFPTVAGMLVGRWILLRIRPNVFRVIFLLGLLALGILIVAKNLT